MLTSSSSVAGTGSTTVLKRREGAGQFVHALVAVVGGGNDREAARGLYLAAQLGDGQVFPTAR